MRKYFRRSSVFHPFIAFDLAVFKTNDALRVFGGGGFMRDQDDGVAFFFVQLLAGW